MASNKEPIGLSIKLATLAQRALANAGITTLSQLSKHTEKEIAELHGIGKNALEQIKLKLSEEGLWFKYA